MHEGLAEDEDVVGVKEVSELMNELRGVVGGPRARAGRHHLGSRTHP